MKYNVSDILQTLTDDKLKIIINKKLFNLIMFMEMSLNNSG